MERAGSTSDDTLAHWILVNDLRLVPRERLDISAESSTYRSRPMIPSQVATFAPYSYLSWLLEQMVEAITARGLG